MPVTKQITIPEMNCRRCLLHRYRTNIVIGRGNPLGRYLFIGEAPGRTEDFRGLAFTGQSGRLLDRLIREACIPSDDVYFTNCLLCRPCDRRGADNRVPLQQELAACGPNIEKIISQLAAKQVVLVGATAQKIYASVFPGAVKILHPSYLLRKGGPAAPQYGLALRALQEMHDAS